MWRVPSTSTSATTNPPSPPVVEAAKAQPLGLFSLLARGVLEVAKVLRRPPNTERTATVSDDAPVLPRSQPAPTR